MQALIPLALEGTDVGKVKAAHGLAKIAAVSNPDIAFPGERVGIWGRVIGLWQGSSLLSWDLPPFLDLPDNFGDAWISTWINL